MVVRLNVLDTVKWPVFMNCFQSVSGNAKKGRVFYKARGSKKKYKPNNLTIYVVRYLKTGKNNMGSSAPCKNCTEKIKQAGIKKIVYIDEDTNLVKVNSNNYTTEFISSGYREYNRKNIKTK